MVIYMLTPKFIRTLLFTICTLLTLTVTHTAFSEDVLAPTITITSPSSGATLTSTFTNVTFQVTGYTIGNYDSSHVAFFIDNDPMPYEFFNGNDSSVFGNQVVLADFARTSQASWINNNTIRFNWLPNGTHTIVAKLVDADNNPLPNPEATYSVSFTVNAPIDDATNPTSLIFVKQQNNTTTPYPDESYGMGRVFDNSPDVISDLYLLAPVNSNGTVYQLTDVAVNGGGVVDPEVSWDGQKVVFSMKQSTDDTWHIYLMDTNGANLTQLTFDPPYDKINDQDPEFLPDGRIIFVSDRLKKREIKPYDQNVSTQLYTVNADGSDLRLIEYNPNFDINPVTLRSGRIGFDRWDHLHFTKNKFAVWEMNQDGTAGFVSYGGVSPRFDQTGGENANGIEHRQLSTGEFVGLFTHRENLASPQMGIFDNRGISLENLPDPVIIGPVGLYRTPYPLTATKLVYGYTPNSDPIANGFGLYTMVLNPEVVAVDDTTSSTAAGGYNPDFRTYNVATGSPTRFYIEVTGSADDNGSNPGDLLWVNVDGVDYNNDTENIERILDGELVFGMSYKFRLDVDLSAGNHVIKIATQETPTLNRVRIVRAIVAINHTLLYDDPTTNEISPIPVRSRNLPPVYPSQVNHDLNWGTFVVRDVSLRGDFRQPNYLDPEGDPNYPYHLDLSQIQGVRVYQNQPRREDGQNALIGTPMFDASRVLGIAQANATGTAAFKVYSGNTTAWEVVGNDGSAISHERVWSWVDPGEVRSCGGCHVGAFPYVERDIDPIPVAQDLRVRGEIYTFVDQILLIIQNKCSSCHTGANPAGDVELFGDRDTFDTLVEAVPERTPVEYLHQGEARQSYIFQLLTGNTAINPYYAQQIEVVNNSFDHSSLLTTEELSDLATWIDMGAGFAYLEFGESPNLPQVISVFPADGSTNVSRNSAVSIRFNTAIDRATINNSTFTLVRVSNGQTVAGSWEWGNGYEVTFRPSANLSTTEYELTITTDVRDIRENLLGLQLSQSFSSSFTVGTGTDSTVPQVVEQLPSGNAINAFAPALVRFNEVIDPSTVVTDETIWVLDSKGYYIDGNAHLSESGLEVGFYPWKPFIAGETYTVYLSSEIADLAGNNINSMSYSFTISLQPSPEYHGLAAELATSYDPERVAVNNAGTQLAFVNQFDSTISLYNIGSWDLVNTYTVGNGVYDIKFSPDDSKLYLSTSNSMQVVTLATGVIQTSTAVSNPYRFVVNNAGTRLYILGWAGLGSVKEMDVQVGSPTFGQVLHTFAINQDGTDIAISPDGNTLYVVAPFYFFFIDIPSRVIERTIDLTFYGYINSIALSPDGGHAIITTGGYLALAYIDLELQQFRGEIKIDHPAEYVAYSADGRYLYVVEDDPNNFVVMDAATFDIMRHVPLANDGNSYVKGMAVSPDGQYAFVIQGGVSKVWTFAAGDLSDTTAPQISSAEPADNATNQPVYAPITVSFSEQMDRVTVNSSSIELQQGAIPVAGTLTINTDNQNISFAPDSLFTPGATYSLQIDNSLSDLAGNTLANSVTNDFSVASTAELGILYNTGLAFNSTASRGIALSPDGTILAVANRYQDSVSFVDPATMIAIGSKIDVGDAPWGMVFNADGSSLFVVNSGTPSSLMEIDVATRVVLRTITGLTGDEELGLSADGTKAFATSTSGLSEINLVTNQVTAPVPTIDRPGRPTLAPNGTVYVPSYDYLWRRNSDGTWTSLFTDNRQTTDVRFSADGRFVFIAGTWLDQLLVYDLQTNQSVTEITIGEDPKYMGQTSDYRHLFVANTTTDTIEIIDTLTLEIVESLSVPNSMMNSLVWDEANNRLFVSDTTANQIKLFTLSSIITADNENYLIRYGNWSGVQDGFAYGGGYRAANTAGDTLTFRIGALPAFNIITYRGPDQGKMQVYVDSVLITTLDLYAATPTYQALETISGLSPVNHTITLVATGTKNPASTGTQIRLDAFLIGGASYTDDNSPTISYKNWNGFAATWLYGGNSRVTSVANSSFSFNMVGSTFTWTTVRCPMCGQAEISVDGAVLTTVDLYNPTWSVQYQQVISGLSAGNHNISIRVLSSKNPASTGYLIFLDSLTYAP